MHYSFDFYVVLCDIIIDLDSRVNPNIRFVKEMGTPKFEWERWNRW